MLGVEAEARITGKLSNETMFILNEAGVEPPPVLEDASGEDIFLVDHSEYAQSVEGMRDAHIVGILDHHGVGNVNTGHQLVYEAKPIGATATIVWLDYKNYGLEIDKSTAHILLGAILSDTNGLTVSTVTGTDRQAVDDLSERMKAEMVELADKLGVDLLYTTVGIREPGLTADYVIPLDERSEETLKAAFPDYDEYNGTAYIYRSGLPRKTVFVPGMNDFLGAHPHE